MKSFWLTASAVGALFAASQAAAQTAAPSNAGDASMNKMQDFKSTGAKSIPVVAQDPAKAADIEKTLAHIKLPPGFKISLYAQVPDARMIAIGPQGVATFVSTRKDKIYALTDRSRAGQASEVKEFAPTVDFKNPNGICFSTRRHPLQRRAEPHSLLPGGGVLLRIAGRRRQPGGEAGRAHPDVRGKLQPFGARLPRRARQQALRDGRPALQRLRAGEVRHVLQGGPRQHHRGWIRTARTARSSRTASAIRSAWTSARPTSRCGSPTTRWTAWATTCRRARSTTRPRWARTSASPGTAAVTCARSNTRTRRRRADVVFPVVEEVAHAADLGMMFYSGRMFPKEYKGAIFSAQHGSWNRTDPGRRPRHGDEVQGGRHAPTAARRRLPKVGSMRMASTTAARSMWSRCATARCSFRTISPARSTASPIRQSKSRSAKQFSGNDPRNRRPRHRRGRPRSGETHDRRVTARGRGRDGGRLPGASGSAGRRQERGAEDQGAPMHQLPRARRRFEAAGGAEPRGSGAGLPRSRSRPIAAARARTR